MGHSSSDLPGPEIYEKMACSRQFVLNIILSIEIMNNTFLFSSCCACRILAFSSKCLAKNSSVCKQERKFKAKRTQI